METRIIATSIFRDTMELDDKEFRILLFLLSNEVISLLPVYKITLGEVALFCNTTPSKVSQTIPKLEKFGVVYFNEFFIIKESYTRTNYSNIKTFDKRKRLHQSLPESIKKIVDENGFILSDVIMDTGMDTGIQPSEDTHLKSKTINLKSKTINLKSKNSENKNLEDITSGDLEEISRKYEVPLVMVENSLDSLENYVKSSGKKYKDYKSALINFVKRDKENLQKLKYTTNERTRYGKSASYFGK